MAITAANDLQWKIGNGNKVVQATGNYFGAAFNDLFQNESFVQPLVYFCIFKILLVHSGTEMTFPLKEIKKKKRQLFSQWEATKHALLDSSFMKYIRFPLYHFLEPLKKRERTENPLFDGEYFPLKASLWFMFTPGSSTCDDSAAGACS